MGGEWGGGGLQEFCTGKKRRETLLLLFCAAAYCGEKGDLILLFPLFCLPALYGAVQNGARPGTCAWEEGGRQPGSIGVSCKFPPFFTFSTL